MIKDISKLHWIKQTEEYRYEMILDHHMLATWRMCQVHFELLHMEGRRPKNGYSWSLEFGIIMHKVIDDLYKWKEEGTYSVDRIASHAISLWDAADMDRFKDHPTYKSLGGKLGFIALCHQYVNYYTSDTERLRIVGTEIGFGSNKEVPLGLSKMLIESDGEPDYVWIDCFLSGRIDFLADDGVKIGPLDHKTRAVFGRKDLSSQYNPHDGMTGYIYATRHILNHRFPAMAEKRKCNSAWMNFIQVQNEPDMQKRFKRVLLMRTDYQLEEYRLRQIETFKDIFNYLYYGKKAQWNTEACNHWYGTNCMYQPVHRQADRNSQLLILQQDFTSGVYWNPEGEELENGHTVSRDNTSYQTTVQE